jgi:ferredoxin
MVRVRLAPRAEEHGFDPRSRADDDGGDEDASMTWVITRLCRDCLDTSCVDACPVDCIYEYVGPSDHRFPNQLYIDPEECIDCQACEPVCPWEAPLRDSDVPGLFEDDIALNALVLEFKEHFVVPAHTDKPQPTPDDVAANRRKWS